MATTQQVAELRLEIKEPLDVEPYTDAFLAGLIDAYGVTASAYRVWISKRNAVANLVDITEGGSSRKMSQLFDNYAKIVATYETAGDTPASAGRPPMTRAATRA